MEKFQVELGHEENVWEDADGTLELAGGWDLIPGKKGQDEGKLQPHQGRFRVDLGKIPPGKGLAQRDLRIFLAGNDNAESI